MMNNLIKRLKLKFNLKGHFILKKILFIFILFNLESAIALNLNLNQAVQKTTSHLSVSLERADFIIDSDTINGVGLKLDFAHHFSSRFEVNAGFFSAFNGAQSNVSFSGLGAIVYYDVFGQCCSSVTTTNLGNNTIYTESSSRNNFLQMGLGLDQFYLNGNKAVYSSSGINLGTQYSFNLFDYNLKAAARYSFLGTNKIKIQATFFSLGIVFPL